MKTSAIICELNPLHHGHAHILSEMRRDADCVIAIMSGHFVQRAEPAIFDKYARAEMALDAGADLVVELPFPWCAASAEFFASAGAAIAEKLRADTLVFGVGAGDPSVLSRAADVFLDPTVQAEIAEAIKKQPTLGIAIVRENCLKSRLGKSASDIMRTPNDILAIEYLKQICANGYAIQPHFVPRLTSDSAPDFLGATEIRARIFSDSVASVKENLPPYVYARACTLFENGDVASSHTLAEIAFQAFRLSTRISERPIAEGEGGLFNRIFHAAQNASSPAELLVSASTKRYTNARIRRVLLNYLLQVAPHDVRRQPRVTTLLAANAVGRAYLSEIRKNSSLTVIANPADCRTLAQSIADEYEFTIAADRLYTLCTQKRKPSDFYFGKHPIIK